MKHTICQRRAHGISRALTRSISLVWQAARRRAAVIVCLSVLSPVVHADYNANMSGVPINVSTYDSGWVLIQLSNQPTSHPTCNPSAFFIDKTLDPVLINRMLARALAAHAAQQPLNIGYDNAGNCANGYIRVHRVG